MKKTKVLFAFGGESAEHEVSVDSAKYVYSLLDKKVYDITLCFVDRSGIWRHVQDFDDMASATTSPEFIPHLGRAELIDSEDWRLKPDLIFPIMLGPNGEDGSVQGLAQLLHIPVAGCGVTGSAICMDKIVTKRLLKQAKIPVADYIVHHASQPTLSFDDIVEQLGLPFFIKPANLGSSIGITKVNNSDDFMRGLKEAHAYEQKIIIERAIDGAELGCGVIGNETPEASDVSMIQLGENDFFTYDAKYLGEKDAQIVIPADLSENIREKVRAVALKAYTALECRGFARVDLFLTSDGRVLVNELNTIPAFRSDSSFPKLWKASGLEPNALVDKIINLALSKA